MDYLEKAKAEIENFELSATGSMHIGKAMAYASIAQAEAIREQTEAIQPRWVQIGTHVINLAQVAYINLKAKDFDGNRRVEIAFAATSDEGSMTLVFGGEEYEKTVIKLSDALYGCMAGSDPSE